MDERHTVTALLLDWNDARPGALDELMPLVYRELRRLARRHLNRERRDHTLQPTALVNEAYLRLVDQERVTWQNRAHFFGLASQIMRRILVDHARRRSAVKRDGMLAQTAGDVDVTAAAVEVLTLNAALERLAALDPTQARVVELRFFGGLTLEEVAEALGVSASTIKREWRFAKAWLHRELALPHDERTRHG